MKAIKIPPDASSLMESTRAMGYSLQTAAADIIDNSIAANAMKIDIYFSAADEYIAFLDDGCGMNETELNQAMKYGSVNPLKTRNQNDLGRFGLGLKTASLSQCEVLTVISKKDNKISARQWNLNHIRCTNAWELLALSTSEMKKLPIFELLKNLKTNGTLVIWQELERMIQGDDMAKKMSEKMDIVRGHLSLVFHRYLSNEEDSKKICICMNNSPVESSDPFLQHRNTQRMAEYTINVDDYPPIKVVPYMLPHASKLSKKDIKLLGITDDLQKNQGFYVYRNKRLIVWGTWFNRNKKNILSQLARIKIDIPVEFDHLWVIDVKKSSATPPLAIRKNLDSLIENLSAQSKRSYEYRGRNEMKDNVPHFWNRLKTREGSVIYEINGKHPMILNLIEKFPECETHLKKIFKHIVASIPFNYLMKDLNDDETEIENKNLYSEDDVRNLLEVLVKGMSKAQVVELCHNLKKIEPYSRFPNLIEEFTEN